MNYKTISIVLAIIVIVLVAAFVIMEFKSVSGPAPTGEPTLEEVNATEEVEKTFGEPPEGFEPPTAPT